MSLNAFFPTVVSLATSLALSSVVPLSIAVIDPCSSVAIAARTYGTDGQDGASGRSGADGADGVNQTVEAGEQLLELDLQGADGGDGSSGSQGKRARCRSHNRPNEDVNAASGGDGGSGGSGGDGGDGGSVTVYYSDLSHLRNVSINAAGGRGGRGASGGSGGQGCNCNEYSWSETRCTDGSCETENFSCKDGTDGRRGSSGSRGKTGSTGRARIIDQTVLEGERLLGDNPTIERAIADLAEAPIDLSRNLWETRTGAGALFNGNSVVDDTYEAYTGRVEKQFQLIWNADYAQSQASGELSVSIDEAGDIQISAPDELWIDGDRTDSDTLTAYRVQYALLASEAADLSLGRSEGRGEQLALSVIDLAGKSDLIETQFHIRYKTKSENRRGMYMTRYEGALPSELLSRDHNRFALKVGQLPIDNDYLKPGTQARLEITITRSLADNTAERVLTWNGEL